MEVKIVNKGWLKQDIEDAFVGCECSEFMGQLVENFTFELPRCKGAVIEFKIFVDPLYKYAKDKAILVFNSKRIEVDLERKIALLILSELKKRVRKQKWEFEDYLTSL